MYRPISQIGFLGVIFAQNCWSKQKEKKTTLKLVIHYMFRFSRYNILHSQSPKYATLIKFYCNLIYKIKIYFKSTIFKFTCALHLQWQ